MTRLPPYVPEDGRSWAEQGYDLSGAARRYADFKAQSDTLDRRSRSIAALEFARQEREVAVAQGVASDDPEIWRISVWPKHLE